MLHEPTVHFLKSAGIHKGMSVAEFGCGTGSIACWIAEYVGETGKVFAIDKGYEQLSITKRRAEELNINNIELIRKEITDDFIDLDVDMIYMRCFLHHLKHPEKILKKAIDLLPNNGILVCIEPIISAFWTYPKIPEANEAIELYLKLGHKFNLDFNIGEKLYYYLSKIKDLSQFNVRIEQSTGVTTFEKSWLEMITAECASIYIEEELASDEDMDRIITMLTKHTKNDSTLATLPTFVCVSAIKKQEFLSNLTNK